jgi:hypothetical protein
MVNYIVHQSQKENKNILILGSPRSGTHALASVMHQVDNSFVYLKEIGMIQKNSAPWQDFKVFFDNTPRKLAHAVQSYAKIFGVSQVQQIKKQTLIVSLRRRDKVKQFASWQYFQKIGAIYNFDHKDQDFIAPGSITATMNDIESFIIDQIIDMSFAPDYVLYYEDLNLKQSNISKNVYCYPIENIFSNLDFVKDQLENWKYND